jgi:hypothetical protein
MWYDAAKLLPLQARIFAIFPKFGTNMEGVLRLEKKFCQMLEEV